MIPEGATEMEIPTAEEMSARMRTIEEEHERKTGRSMPSKAEVDSFLSRVEDTHQKVSIIIVCFN